MLVHKDEIITTFETVKGVLFDTAALDIEHADLQSELAVITELIQKCVDESAHISQSQDEYLRRYEGMVGRFGIAKHRLEEVGDLLADTKARREMLEIFTGSLRNTMTWYDEQLWYSLVDYATVYSEDDVRFTFKDGTI